ncbi:hypothetical protein BS627_09125 [Agrobacterium salinitolerans]|nr:hypothetical protein BS627_09125 [Agrobacterium salinitolerans]PNQ25278.1 hypothetical protein C2E26_09305 [Rhizobium sp. YIC5082]
MVATANFAVLPIVIFVTAKISRCFQTVERVLKAGCRGKAHMTLFPARCGSQGAATGKNFAEKWQ